MASKLIPQDTTTTPFKTLDQPVLHNRPLKVILIGAGLTGMHLVARVKEFGPGIELFCYERNPDAFAVGGTWYANRYPGVAVDSPSVGYTLTWAPWHDWSRYQANGSDCLKYCNHLADLTGVRDITRFNSDVKHVEWDDKEEKWILTIKDNKTGEEFKDEAPIIVNASGILSQPKMPDLPGMKDFNGRVLHTARYDTEIDLKGKRVALVGAGSTSIQVLPQIQKVAAKVDCYIRSSTWVIPMFAADVRDKYFGFDSSDGFSADTADRINPYYTDEDRKQWKEKPETLYQHRKDIMNAMNAFFADGFTQTDSPLSQEFRRLVVEGTQKKLAKKPELIDLFTPRWDPGCRRATPGVEYHKALQEDNVEVFRRGIDAMTKTGIVDSKGEEREYDAVIFATGFRTDFNPPWTTKGRDGYSLNEKDYLSNPKGYMVCFAPKHPNYFSIAGPALMAFNGDFLPGQERLMDLIFKTVLKMQRERIKSVEAKPEAINAFMEYVDEYLKRTVHAQECSSWYKGGTKDGRIRAIWPGSTLHMMETISNPKWEDFDYTYMDKQDGPERFLWMGNGRSHYDYSDDRAPYMRAVSNPERPVEARDPNKLVNLVDFHY